MKEDDWDLVIEPGKHKSVIDFKELSRYKDLILLFVKRDFISLYKQTVLGPLWVVIQPILTTITFSIVFFKIANIGTGVHPILFYMLGVTTWTYFADCVVKTSETFVANQNIFGKVYFPRLVTPISIVITNLIKFGIQLGLFLLIYVYFTFFTDDPIQLSWPLLFFPAIILIMAMLGLGIGLFIASMTTKYRDLRFLIQFGIQLAMYATPIVYPLSKINPEYQWIVQLNPMTSLIETLKVGFFGFEYGVFSWFYLGYSLVFSMILLFVGVKVFTRIEKSFMDSI